MDPFQQQQQQNINYNGLQTEDQASSSKPYVRILEQPASKALRFRYECEGHSAGSIPGVRSTPRNKTYPSIEIIGYKGPAKVIVSCVTNNEPYRPHPHNLVGKNGCLKGVCVHNINSETMTAVFKNMGIQCVKKKNMLSSLNVREEINVDPFKTGFSHKHQLSSFDLNSLRLCFEVFIKNEENDDLTVALAPVVSEPIYDKKAMTDLAISHLSSYSASVLGNTELILLCEKVCKDDISIRFYEEKNGRKIWKAKGIFRDTDVHNQTSIIFRTPPYRNFHITEPAKVFIQLKRPSDGITSQPLQFEYTPLKTETSYLRCNCQKPREYPVQFSMQQSYRQSQQNYSNNTDPQVMSIVDYDVLSQPRQEQHHVNNFGNIWETEFNRTAFADNNLNNLNITNTSVMQNTLQVQVQSNSVTTTSNPSISVFNSNNDGIESIELDVSNLLNFDRDQYVRINSVDQ